MSFLTDGFSTIVTLSIPGLTPVVLLEREVQPPGVDGGGPIDTTTMRNRAYRTKWNKKLVTMEEMTLQCQYDPAAYVQIISNYLQVKMVITVTFPDGSTLAFGGWVETFKPVSHKEGEFPLAEVKIMPGLQNLDMSIAYPTLTQGGTVMSLTHNVVF